MSSPEQVATTPPPVGNDNPAAPQAAVRTAGMAGAGPSPEQLPRLLPDSAVFVNEFTRPLPDPAVTFSGPGYFSPAPRTSGFATAALRSEEHTSELQSRGHLVCRLLLVKKNIRE